MASGFKAVSLVRPCCIQPFELDYYAIYWLCDTLFLTLKHYICSARLYKGQLKGLKVNLNHSRSELEQVYGQPDEVGFENADYLKYDNCYFYIWDENNIGVIDIKINESVEQVKKVLGEPDFEGNSDGGYDEYGLSYTTGDYSLYFMYEDAASTEGIVRIKSIY